jgi:DNA processing protein
VAGGVDVVYPPENQKLYEQLCVEGCVVAESPFATEPLARHFPRRNRIISGLSLGVLIVEAAAKSGSLITARMALEQNREVFAVPGSPLDPRAEGGNRLIKDGAHLVMRADDILHVMDSLRLRPLRDGGRDWQAGGAIPPAADSSPDDKLRDLILENLSPTPTDLNDLIRTVQAPIPLVLTVILELELAGRIERQAGNKINLV